ncbi:hypothetical protein GGR52DRAFT_568194 [Hypoxylon sp. FL1284]|nr:hypothetical protein GGR52DRAFT_568194 [Hypoxylon sp. FL1284]
MGWMWSTPSPPKSPGPESNSSSSSRPVAPESGKPKEEPQSSVYGDVEIDKFMAELQAGFGVSKPVESSSPPEHATPPPPQEEKPSSSWFSWGTSSSSSAQAEPSPSPFPSSSDTPTYARPSAQSPSIRQAAPPDRLDPVSESLLPSTMSCRAAFDAAYHCNSLGGQWTSVYRSGGVRSCSEHWDDFWFCMRTRALPAPQKADAIRDRYRRREWEKYHAPGTHSSADVWQPRDDKVQPNTAFQEPLEFPDISDEDWRRLEIERRKRIREELGYVEKS